MPRCGARPTAGTKSSSATISFLTIPLALDAPGVRQNLDAAPEGKNFDRLWHMTPRQVVDELFESDAVKTLVLSQMTIPRGVAFDYSGGGVEVLKMIAGDEKPELARGGSTRSPRYCSAHTSTAAARFAPCTTSKRFSSKNGRAVGVGLRDGREWKLDWRWCPIAIPTRLSSTWWGKMSCRHVCRAGQRHQVDEFAYFQLHVALKAPVRYALHEANDPAVAQAMNVNIGPEKPQDIERNVEGDSRRRVS